MSISVGPPGTKPRATVVLGKQRGPFGALPWVFLATALGLALVSVADAFSRTGRDGGSVFFWAAVVLILFPAALRLTGERAGSGERAATVVTVGLALYGIKVLRDPFAFTFGDELAHLHNAQEIIARARLFGANSILPITPRYPGVESVAAALARMGGLSPFAAGLLVIAAARVIFMLAVYLVYERLTGSPRLAGIGALVATAAPTFLFFSAQFSYESLAVPLAGVALFALVRWLDTDRRAERLRWGALVVLIALAVMTTHHLTSYALALLLLLICAVHVALKRARAAPWAITGIVTVLTLAWLTLVASRTVGYLSPVIGDAIDNVLETVRRESGTRTLFRSTNGVEQTPAGERAVAVLGVGLLALAIITGARVSWRRWRNDPVLLLLALAAIAYLATLPLRVVPAAWETASRSGSFLFLGVGLTAAAGMVWLLDRRPGAPARALAAGVATVVVAGGMIAGWPASLRLGQPLRVVADGRAIDSPVVEAARWSRLTLGAGRRVGAQDADARMFLVEGRQTAFQGVNPDVRDILDAERLEPWQGRLLREQRISLLVSDRRTVSADNIAGYFFDVRPPDLAPPATTAKFDIPVVDRLYDSGNIVIFDVRGLW